MQLEVSYLFNKPITFILKGEVNKINSLSPKNGVLDYTTVETIKLANLLYLLRRK
jgi:hypothetical protein